MRSHTSTLSITCKIGQTISVSMSCTMFSVLCLSDQVFAQWRSCDLCLSLPPGVKQSGDRMTSTESGVYFIKAAVNFTIGDNNNRYKLLMRV